MILLAVELWGERFRIVGLAILGDNVAALNGAISLKGKAEIARITRELAWRKVRRGWRFSCGHLPAEHNDMADCLSRLTAPEANSERPARGPFRTQSPCGSAGESKKRVIFLKGAGDLHYPRWGSGGPRHLLVRRLSPPSVRAPQFGVPPPRPVDYSANCVSEATYVYTAGGELGLSPPSWGAPSWCSRMELILVVP